MLRVMRQSAEADRLARACFEVSQLLSRLSRRHGWRPDHEHRLHEITSAFQAASELLRLSMEARSVTLDPRDLGQWVGRSRALLNPVRLHEHDPEYLELERLRRALMNPRLN
jgi:hypothetical protein